MFKKPRKPVLLKSLIQSLATKMEISSEEFHEGTNSDGLTPVLDGIKNTLHQSPDLICRQFSIGETQQAAIVYIDGLIDKNQIEESILTPLMVDVSKLCNFKMSSDLLEYIKKRLITVGSIKTITHFKDIPASILSGNTLLILEGCSEALEINTPGWEKRSITEPETELVIRGPRVGFTETIRTNTALLRRVIGHPNLTFENTTVGKKTKTQITMAYIKGIVREDLLVEIKKRLKKINTDAVQLAGTLEQFIEDAPFSPFPTIGYTERPDVAAAKLLEGRVLILVDGTPVSLTIPFLFVESFQTPDDYSFRPYYYSILRWIRYIAFTLSVLSPAIYVALTTFHQELIPTPLLITMAAATEGTPFPAVVEALGMGLVFEILREAGIRLPRPIGQTISIVGALVIGQATVQAGLVGAPMVIVVAITAIASFVTPQQSDSGALLRFGFTLLAGFMGAFGIIIGFLFVLIHLAALRSFGTPYLAPLAPTVIPDLKDVLFRAPVWMMKRRPLSLEINDVKRQGDRQMPVPPSTKKTGRKKDDVI